MIDAPGAALPGDNPPLTPSGAPAGHWADALPETIRGHAKLREFKDVAGLANSYVNQLELVGRKTIGLTPLPENATDDQRKAWETDFRKLSGVPEAPEKYEFKGKVPEGYNLDNPGMADFKRLAHESGISPAQFNRLVQHLFDVDAKLKVDAEGFAKKQAEESEQAMRKEWGENYDAKRQSIERVISAFGNEEFVKGVKERGLGNDPHFLRFMDKVSAHFQESSLKGDGGSTLTPGVKSREELFSMRADPKYGKDPAYTKQVDDAYNAAFPGDYPLTSSKG